MDVVKNFIRHKIKFDSSFKKELLMLRQLEELDASKIKELESRKLIYHIKNAYQKSTFYKDLYDKYGINLNQIQNREDLDKLPIITKENIRENVEKLYTGNKLLKYKGYTSGTSGTPLTVFYSKNCINIEAAYVEIFYNRGGFFLGNKAISLRGVLDKNKREYFNKYSNTLFLSSFNINEENTDFYYNKILEFKPKAIMAYPSSLEMLSNLFLDKGYVLNIPVVFTSSETLYAHQRDKIEKVFNTKIYDLYGNAERSIMLIQKKSQGFYYEPNLYSINEYYNDYIITTNIFNVDFPLIRYKVNDTVKLVDDSKRTIIESIEGRIDDYLFLKDGSRVGRMDLVFKGVNNIKLAQIIQNEIDYFVVNIVSNEAYSLKDEKMLVEKIKQRIGYNTKFKIQNIEEKDIIKTAANKFKLVYNRL